MYLRDLIIQEQDEKLYEETKQSDIKRAFIAQVLQMKKGKNYFIFGGRASDCTSLEFIEHLSNNEKIKFQITEGDITSRKGVNLQNCIVKVNNHVMDFIKEIN